MSDDQSDLDPSEDEELSPTSPPSPSMEYSAPISAVPPRVMLQEEGQMEVSASPAFQCLDDMFQEGKLTGTKVAQLKAKYTELHETLKRTRDNEGKYMEQGKSFMLQLDQQQKELESADVFPDTTSNAEVQKLRQQLLTYTNKLAQTDEVQYQLDYKIECLREEFSMVEREYSRMPKQEEVDKKREELKLSCADVRKEIVQRGQETKNLKEDLEKRNRQIQKECKELDGTLEKVEALKSELVGINSQPGQISKESDKLFRQQNEVKKKLKAINAQLNELSAAKLKVEGKQTSLVEEKNSLDGQVDKHLLNLKEKERSFQAMSKDNDYARERAAVLMGDRATLDLNLRHINLEKKNIHETHSRKVREKDRDLRKLKKVELQLKIAEDALQHSQQQKNKVQAETDAMIKDSDNQFHLRRTEVSKDVDGTRRSLANQNSLTAAETVKVEQSIAEEERLLYEQSDLRIEVVELQRLAQIKNDEREQKSRDFKLAERRFQKAVQDLKMKKLQIQEQHKKDMEMQTKLRDHAKHYEVIKTERNKMVNLIQTSTQKAAEMKEKIKILQNEIEILRTAVAHKDRHLQKQKLRHNNAIVIRDSLRNDVAKAVWHEEEMKERREQQKMDIGKLNLLINQAEAAMQKLRKQYDTSVQHRNDRGIELIERNEEVCIFYEKVNIQDTMIRNGDVELAAREEELRFLKLHLAEEQRSIALLRKNQPTKRNLDDELVTLQLQLANCQDLMLELEEKMKDPTDDSRVRFLEGKDPTPGELQTKLEELEMRLAEKEEQMLEKDLVFEQVCRLADKVRNKSESGKQDTLSLAKKVNELQGQIKDVTRKMMSLVSELSMHQANALGLQQQVKEKEEELEQCYRRLQKGEAPNDIIEREWLRLVRDEERKINEREAMKMARAEEEQYMLPSGIATTAEPRPNAYVPDNDNELPIPRPYGSHAPFKPSDAGSSMRHTRKPIPKPIEI